MTERCRAAGRDVWDLNRDPRAQWRLCVRAAASSSSLIGRTSPTRPIQSAICHLFLRSQTLNHKHSLAVRPDFKIALGRDKSELHGRQDQAESLILISMRVKIIDGKWNDLPSSNEQDGASVCRGGDDVDPGLRSLYLKTVITLFF